MESFINVIAGVVIGIIFTTLYFTGIKDEEEKPIDYSKLTAQEVFDLCMDRIITVNSSTSWQSFLIPFLTDRHFKNVNFEDTWQDIIYKFYMPITHHKLLGELYELYKTHIHKQEDTNKFLREALLLGKAHNLEVDEY